MSEKEMETMLFKLFQARCTIKQIINLVKHGKITIADALKVIEAVVDDDK